MASIPVYLLSISGKITILYVTYKVIQKLTKELWYSSPVSVDTGAPGASLVPPVFPARFSSSLGTREEIVVEDFHDDSSEEDDGNNKENKKSESPGTSLQEKETLEFNFLDLPLRPGERVCWDYMHDGNCKHGHNCRFDHPNPIAVVGGDIPSGSLQLHLPDASQLASTSGFFPSNETIHDQDATNSPVPVVMLPPQEGILASNGDQQFMKSQLPVGEGASSANKAFRWTRHIASPLAKSGSSTSSVEDRSTFVSTSRGRGQGSGFTGRGHGSWGGSRHGVSGRNLHQSTHPFRQCSHCGKTNHLVDKCWEKHGKPKWLQCSLCGKTNHTVDKCWQKYGKPEFGQQSANPNMAGGYSDVITSNDIKTTSTSGANSSKFVCRKRLQQLQASIHSSGSTLAHSGPLNSKDKW